MRRKLSAPLYLSVALIALVVGIFVYLNSQKLEALPSPPLHQLANNHDIELGNFAIATKLTDSKYTDILTNQFNLALIDNTPNWYFTDGGLRPSATTFNFKQMDEVVSFADANNMYIQAHHFVWGEQKWLPDWLENGHFDKDQLLEIMHNHIPRFGYDYA